MPLIVDTYNVLHVTGVLPPDLAGLDVPGLADLIRPGRYRHEQVQLVCDGSPPPGGIPAVGPSVEVLYSGPHCSADDLIGRIVTRSSDRRRLIVISSDREVALHARRAGCRVLRSEAFLEQLAEDAERPTGAPRRPAPRPSTGGVEQWMRIFGLDENELDAADPDPPLPPELERQVRPKPPRRADANGAKDATDASDPTETPASRPAAGPLPDEIIAEAERLWRELGRPGTAPERTELPEDDT